LRILLEELIQDHEVSGRDVMRRNLLLANRYDETQVCTKLSQLRFKFPKPEELQAELQRINSGETSANRKKRKAGRTQELKRIGAEKLKNQLDKAMVTGKPAKKKLKLSESGEYSSASSDNDDVSGPLDENSMDENSEDKRATSSHDPLDRWRRNNASPPIVATVVAAPSSVPNPAGRVVGPDTVVRAVEPPNARPIEEVSMLAASALFPFRIGMLRCTGYVGFYICDLPVGATVSPSMNRNVTYVRIKVTARSRNDIVAVFRRLTDQPLQIPELVEKHWTICLEPPAERLLGSVPQRKESAEEGACAFLWPAAAVVDANAVDEVPIP